MAALDRPPVLGLKASALVLKNSQMFLTPIITPAFPMEALTGMTAGSAPQRYAQQTTIFAENYLARCPWLRHFGIEEKL